MESGAISDAQISASTEWSASNAAIYGRLHFRDNGSKAGAWSAGIVDANQWLQIDLTGQNSIITRVATQGRDSVCQWVTQYTLQYTNDSSNFQDYTEDRENVIKVKQLIN